MLPGLATAWFALASSSSSWCQLWQSVVTAVLAAGNVRLLNLSLLLSCGIWLCRPKCQGFVIKLAQFLLYDCMFNAQYCHGLSVRLSVCLSNTCFVTKRKKLVPTFLYHMKDYSVYTSFLTRRMVGGGNPSTWNFSWTDPFGTKTPIFSQYSLVAPQP